MLCLQGGAPIKLQVDDTTVRIGDVVAPRRIPKQIELVPSPGVFYDNPRHIHLLQRMLADYVAGEKAMLLVGNQVRYSQFPRLYRPIVSVILVWAITCKIQGLGLAKVLVAQA